MNLFRVTCGNLRQYGAYACADSYKVDNLATIRHTNDRLLSVKPNSTKVAVFIVDDSRVATHNWSV